MHPSAAGRLYILGTPHPETVGLWNHAIAAQDVLLSALHPGATLEQAYAKLTEYCAQNQLHLAPTNPLYGLGYVIGETPILFTESGREPLQPGMVLAVAPSIAAKESDRFYCCADTFLITENGTRRLTNMPRELVTVCLD